MDLHSTMFLLIRHLHASAYKCFQNLHSTMFLLIHGCNQPYKLLIRIYIPLCFYLYDMTAWAASAAQWHLHSTMFLLIHIYNRIWEVTENNLHSTMFLLIPVHFSPLIHAVSRLPNCRSLYFLPHPPLFSCLFFYFPVYYSRNMRFVDFPQFRHYLRSTITGSYLFYHLGCPRILLVSTFHFGT